LSLRESGRCVEPPVTVDRRSGMKRVDVPIAHGSPKPCFGRG
jgi:hypothetical protein